MYGKHDFKEYPSNQVFVPSLSRSIWSQQSGSLGGFSPSSSSFKTRSPSLLNPGMPTNL